MTVTDPYAAINTRRTPQNRQADPRQEANSAGGFTFTIDGDQQILRFLMLGTDGGTFYASTADHTEQAAQVVLAAARRDATHLTDLVLQVSLAGRAPKQNPCLLSLAAAAALGDLEGRRYALAALPRVARTGTHLFLFARYVRQFRGWGPALAKAVSRWYLDKAPHDLAYQLIKYRQREGWSHRDLLRLAHPNPSGKPVVGETLRWAVGKPTEPALLPELIGLWADANADGAALHTWVHAARAGLPWDAMPDAALGHAEVWQELIDSRHLPIGALIRQLPRLTRLGVTSSRRAKIVQMLTDPGRLHRGRIHPINVLVAQRTYASGSSARGSGEWTPDRHIVDALDAAFYAAYPEVNGSGARVLLALDVSGSMSAAGISGMPLTAREASAAVALVTMATEPVCDVVGFTGGQMGYAYARWGQGAALTPLAISPRQRLDDAIRTVSNLPFGPTDCALPMLWAQDQGKVYDAIVIYTDNETWHGDVHPHQALQQYRAVTGVNTRLIVVGMTATRFSIADPEDPGSLDVVGFDTSVPQLVSDFARGGAR